ncbi:MAG TPA: MOSC N-terminal beta barrel domain-containing protein [Steroidobacteraceae bacterium]
MPIVHALNIYPVKSARAVPLGSVRLAATGFEWDRQWMTVDAADSFVTQRTHPRLARVVPALGREALTLSAEGLEALEVPLAIEGAPVTVQIFNDTCIAQDQGDEAAEWLSEVIGDVVRLVRVGPRMDRVANPRYAAPDRAPTTFVDGYPILVCSTASLEYLNARMSSPVPMERFRPNLVIDGLSPFEEDRIAALEIASPGGEPVRIRLVKPSTRCVIPSTDQHTGERSTNPLPFLRQFRFDRTLKGITFGENAVIASGVGRTVAVGAHCTVRFDEPPVG